MLPPSIEHNPCDCVGKHCAQCDTPILRTHKHYANAEELNTHTMEFESLGPIHLPCVRYRMVGLSAEDTRRALRAWSN